MLPAGRWCSSPEVAGGVRLAAGVVRPSEQEISAFLFPVMDSAPFHDGGMTLRMRHARRFGRAASSGLTCLLCSKGFPQLSQEDWVALYH